MLAHTGFGGAATAAPRAAAVETGTATVSATDDASGEIVTVSALRDVTVAVARGSGESPQKTATVSG
jgi:hypothetical protein